MGAGHPRGKSGGDGSQLSAKCSAHKGLSLELVTPSPNLYDDNADITKISRSMVFTVGFPTRDYK